MVVACVGVLLIGEGVARITPRTLPEVGPNSAQTLLQGHATRIWSLIPGTNNNGMSTATINALGLRGPEPTMPRPTAQQRVLVMGDSSFFGHSVKDDETLSYFLQRRLRADGVDVEVINAGVPGYSTLQGRELLREVGWDLEPTLLLLGFLWSDNHFDNHADRDLLRRRRAARYNPLVHSVLFQWLAERVTQVFRPKGQTIDWRTSVDNTPSVGEQVRRVALTDYAEQLAVIAADAAERGAGTALLTPTNPGQLSGETPRLHSSWMPYYDAQAEIADAYGLVRIDALPALRATQIPPEALFVDVMHPSGAANELFANSVADALAAAGWPEQSLQAKPNPSFDPGDRVDPHAKGWSHVPGPDDREPSPLDGLQGAGPPQN